MPDNIAEGLNFLKFMLEKDLVGINSLFFKVVHRKLPFKRWAYIKHIRHAVSAALRAHFNTGDHHFLWFYFYLELQLFWIGRGFSEFRRTKAMPK